MGFHGSQSAPYLRHLLSYGHQAFWTCRPRGRLLYYGAVADLRLSVWPLGGAKCFSFPLNISLIFEIFADVSTRYGSTRQALEIPPCLAGIPTPMWGSDPKYENFFDRIVTSFRTSYFPVLLHRTPRGCPLAQLKIWWGKKRCNSEKS